MLVFIFTSTSLLLALPCPACTRLPPRAFTGARPLRARLDCLHLTARELVFLPHCRPNFNQAHQVNSFRTTASHTGCIPNHLTHKRRLPPCVIMTPQPSRQGAKPRLSPQSQPNTHVENLRVSAKVQKVQKKQAPKPPPFLSGVLASIRTSTAMSASKPPKTFPASNHLEVSESPRSYQSSTSVTSATIASAIATAYTPLPCPAYLPVGKSRSDVRHKTPWRIPDGTVRKSSFDTSLIAHPAHITRSTSDYLQSRRGEYLPSRDNGRDWNSAKDRSGGSYRHRAATQEEPRRLQNRIEYGVCSVQQLIREVNVRQLSYKHEDIPHLVQLLMFNDKVFSERCKEYKHFNVNELLQEASRLELSFDVNRRWERRSLLKQIAQMLARVAAVDHNALSHSKETDTKIKLRATTPWTDRDSRVRPPTKAHRISLQIKAAELAAGGDKDLKPQSSRRMKKIEGRGSAQTKPTSKVTDSQEHKSTTTKQAKKSHETANQNSSHVHATKSPRIPATIEEDVEGHVNRATEHNTHHSDQQDLLSRTGYSGKTLHQPRIKNNKGVRASREELQVDHKSSEKRKSVYVEGIAPDGHAFGAAQRRDASSAHNEEIHIAANSGSSPSKAPLDELEKAKVPMAEQGEERVTKETDKQSVEAGDMSSLSKDDLITHVISNEAGSSSAESVDDRLSNKYTSASPRKTRDDREAWSSSTPGTSPEVRAIPSLGFKSSNKRKLQGNEVEDEDEEDVPLKKIKMNKKRKPTDIAAEERIPGLTYTKNSNGTWKVKERIKKVGTTTKPKSKTQPTYNFVKS
jgi:hypothetical protein